MHQELVFAVGQTAGKAKGRSGFEEFVIKI